MGGFIGVLILEEKKKMDKNTNNKMNYKIKNKAVLTSGILLLYILLMAGCGKPEASQRDSDGANGDMVSESISADTADEDGIGAAVSGNGTEDTDSGDESQDTSGEIAAFELSNGLHACVTTQVSRYVAIEGITEWIDIYGSVPDSDRARTLLIPNVYGTITDIQMSNFSDINICYEDEEGKDGQVTIPMDFYAVDGNAVEPSWWEPNRLLCYNVEELTNETGYPIEVWSEAFTSGGEEYVAVYSRISPMYESDIVEGSCFAADYQFAIRQGDKTLYEIKLYQMSIPEEEIHYMEDVNGDGIKDFIQISNYNHPAVHNSAPYIFVWDAEQETCISGGPIAPEEKALYNGIFNVNPPRYQAVDYDRDSRIFYDFWDIKMHSLHHDIHDMVIVCGARFIDGEWKTVYELYLGKEGEDYARETKYDDEGNIISEITCTEEEHYDLANKISDECDFCLYEYWEDYTEEDVVVNKEFSYWKYVMNEE